MLAVLSNQRRNQPLLCRTRHLQPPNKCRKQAKSPAAMRGHSVRAACKRMITPVDAVFQQ
jgi:hypothetical protein